MGKGDRHIKRPNGVKKGNYINIKNDRRGCSGDTMSKTNKIYGIYEKLAKYEISTQRYKIKIKWGNFPNDVKKKRHL